MKRSRFYRVGAALIAAAMVFTGMPQGQMYVSAQESGIPTVEEEQEQDQPQTASEEENVIQEKQEDDFPSEEEGAGDEPDEENSLEPGEADHEDDMNMSDGDGVNLEGSGTDRDETSGEAEEEEPSDESAVAPLADPITYSFKGPTKTTYLKGESVDIAGAAITYTSADGKIIQVDVKNAQVAFDSNSVGIGQMTISYDGQSKNFDILVIEAPSLTAEYGQSLSEITLPANTEGSWSWKDSSQQMNKVGKQTYQADFTPTNSKYQTRSGVSATVTVTCDLEQHAFVEIQVPQKGYTYDGTEKKPDVTVSVGNNNLLSGKDYTVSYRDNKNAGDAFVIVTGKGDYKGEKEEAFTILKAKLIVRVTDKTVSFSPDRDDTGKAEDWAEAQKYDYTVSGLAEGDTWETEPQLTCLITQDDIYKPATYAITVTAGKIDDSVKDNYEEEITYINGTLTVEAFEPQPVVIAGMPVELDTTYDKKAWSNADRAVVRIAGGTGNATNVTAVPSYIGTTAGGVAYDSADAPTEAGEYELTFTLSGTDKWKYALREGSDVFQFKIKQQIITVTAPSKTVAAGESVPAADSLKGDIQVTGLLKGDGQDDVLQGELTLKYSDENISAAKAGTYDIIPDGVTVINSNYALNRVNGTLTVEGRKEIEVDFTSIKVKDKTYDGQPHSISGYASDESNGSFLYTIQVTDETRKREVEKEEGAKEEKTDGGDTPDYIKTVKNVPITEIVKKYSEVAPVDVGRYTLEIFLEADKDIYAYDGEALFKSVFYVTLLQKNEMQLAGMTGITDKEYDGEKVDLSNQISSVRLLTGGGVDITDKAELAFTITGTTVHSTDGYSDYNETIDPQNPSAGLPDKAGEYVLHVKLNRREPHNYVENEWKYPFAVKKKKLSITVNGQEMYVGDERLEAEKELPDRFKNQYTVEGVLDADSEKLAEKLTVVPGQTVEADEPGIYDLLLWGLVEAEWADYEITWNNAKLTVKGQLHKIKEELKAVTNVPNGKTLEEIAESYLPKKTTIYLYSGGKAPAPGTSAGEDVEDTAEIVWNTAKTAQGTSYSSNIKVAQTFKMEGEVQLPELVYADGNTPLTVIVSVSVREAYEGQALKPTANVAAGRVALGTKVQLSTTEENAEIIYTVEADNPAVSVMNRRYAEPIEIRSTMTIRAITRVFGKQDSEELRITYYLDKTLDPGGDDNPDDPDNPQVPEEDIPKDENGNKLPIPDDLWVTDVTGYVYTGTAIKPEVRVYDYKKRLEEKKDYTISYKNNINAADKNHPTKAPTITITGKGNYEGKLIKTFTIAPKDIGEADVWTDNLTVAFNGKEQKPVPVVTWKGKKLSAKKDYSFNVSPQITIAAGDYKVTLTGTGNYTGKKEIGFTITDGKPVPKLTVSKIPDCTYTGETFEPKPTVKDGKDILKEGTDYTLEYPDPKTGVNTEVGTGYVIIKGMGPRSGKYCGEKRVTFQIKAAAMMNKAKVAFGPAVYTGSAVEPACTVTIDVKENGVTVNRMLVKDTDYTVTYQNNVKAGKATAVFVGKGSYGGTLKKTFKITGYDLQIDINKKLSIQTADSYPYMKGGSAPKPVIKYDGKTLKEGTDYTVSYKNNTAVGNAASMTIKGKGNFTGSVVKGYLVDIQNLSNVTVSPADKVYQAKAGVYKTKVRVYDTNGKQLSAGKDYDKNVVYTYAVLPRGQKVVTVDGTEREVGDPVDPKDIIPSGAKIKVTVNAVGGNYTGSAEGVYSITGADIAKAKVTVPQQTYTGKAIEPTKKEISVLMNGMPVSADEYEIISYTNNINKGTAKLTIQGQGNYGGTKTVSFKIKGKSLFKLFG